MFSYPTNLLRAFRNLICVWLVGHVVVFNVDAFENCTYVLGHILEPDIRREQRAANIRVQISEIFRDASLSDEARLQRAFEVYWNERILNYTNQERRTIQAGRGSLSFHRGNSFTANAGGMRLPEFLRGTAAQYLVLAHELEHTIQAHDIGLNRSLARRMLFVAELLLLPSSQFYLERAAMQAEWEFVQAIPVTVRNKALRIVQSSALPGWVKNTLVSALESASSLEEYIRIQHGRGRYSYNQELRRVIGNQVIAAALIGLLGVLIDRSTRDALCNNFQHTLSPPQDSQQSSNFYQHALCASTR